MVRIIVYPENNEKLAALKAFMKALKIRFEEEKSPYNPEFVEKIKRSEEDFKAGRYKAIKTEDLWE
jgi:hypothetical protein